MRAVVKGTGMYVPAHVVDNHRLSRIMETSDEWIRQRTGIVTRRYAELDKATSDMAAQKRLGLPDDSVFNNIQKYGNTTAATLPIAFHEARTERDLRPGDLVCFVALGSGVNGGAALYRC